MQKGNSLIEVVVGAAILSMVSLAFWGAFSTLGRFHEKDMYSIKGTLLAEEGIEALRFIKGLGWSNISSIPAGQTKYLAPSANTWSISATPEIVDGVFYRFFQVLPVQRNASDDIVSVNGVVDPDIRLIDVSVSWFLRGATTTAEYKSYITNI